MIDLDTPLEMPRSEPARVWSDFQTQVFDAARDLDYNLLIQAVAGSGKTTTIIQAMQHVSGSSLFMAFNKAIAEDIRRRAYSGDVKTLNALGHRLMMIHRPAAKLLASKTRDILREQMILSAEDREAFSYVLQRVIGLAKNNAFGIHGEVEVDDFRDLIEAYSFEVPEDRVDDVAQMAAFLFDRCQSDISTFDFDDQLWIPLKEQWIYPFYSNVFVDECQDLSPVQHLMLERLRGQGSRIIAVGDRHQSIYGFRGAMVDSMDALKRQFQMLELPLSISYRCDQEIIREAQYFCPTITARAGADFGRIHRCGWDESDPELFHDSLIICRNNAPLFKAILRHVRARRPCRVLSNFIDSFAAVIRGFKAGNIPTLLLKLEAWYEKERSLAEAKGHKGKVAAITDRYETIKLLASFFQTIPQMLDEIKRLGECTVGPIFATVHKAKGLEHERVYILRPDLMPAFYANTEDQKQQEANLQYVAITRAKHELTFGAKV